MNTFALKTTSLALCGAMLFSSCATTKDGRVTQAQGTGGGALAGAALGALLGAATGNYDSIAKFAAIGAASGAVAGFAYGTQVAKKKAAYAKQEDFLDYAIAQAEKSNADAVSTNQRLMAEVSSLESKYGNVASADARTKKKYLAATKGQIASLDKQTTKLDAQIADYNDCLSGEGYGNKSQSATLRAKIKGLEAEKSKLISTKSRLAASQSRIAI